VLKEDYGSWAKAAATPKAGTATDAEGDKGDT
jgi:hypothetical protein